MLSRWATDTQGHRLDYRRLMKARAGPDQSDAREATLDYHSLCSQKLIVT
jgi:hypothetical protein